MAQIMTNCEVTLMTEKTEIYKLEFQHNIFSQEEEYAWNSLSETDHIILV